MTTMLPYMMIAAGAALWGLIAIFVRGLSEYGFTAMEIVTIRVITASLLLIIIGLIRYRSEMKVKVRDTYLFIGTGILSIVFFYWSYFTTINEMNVSLAVILLYTSPAFVTILSYIFLKEPLHMKKVFAVIGTIFGCVLIAGVSVGEANNVTMLGIVIGLCSGLGYALYSIFGKFALRKYEPFTVTLFTFVVAALFLLPVTRIWEKGALLQPEVIGHAIGLGLFPTVIAFILYTKGLEKVESSKAGIIATVEPLVATFLSVFLYHESLTIFQIIGSVFILSSVLIVNFPIKMKKHRTVT
ncbi:DMT family transporter [Bacillus aquiflavi]|nr:DMT family transporter [Bacillus aquiflavi]